jgi:sialic acid synthase SpsE
MEEGDRGGGGMSHTWICAELGGIAEGRQEVMLRQIDAAADAGCDAVKGQWVSNPARLVERRKAQDYAGAYANIAYPLDWLGVMREHATARGLEFGCSVYIEGDAAKVAPFCQFIKLASFEWPDVVMLTEARNTDLRVIASTGMAGSGDDEDVIDDAVYWGGMGVELLHCVSCYNQPIPPDQWNLAAIREYGLAGFSDHTRSVQSGHDAVLAGARILEVHSRLADSNPSNPDYGVALDPERLKDYVTLVREAEVKLGDGIKAAQLCESAMLRYRVTV